VSFASAANPEATVGFTGLVFGCACARIPVTTLGACGGDPQGAGAGTLDGFEADGQAREEVEPSELFDAVDADDIGAEVVALRVLRKDKGGDAQSLIAGLLIDNNLKATLRD